MTSGNTTPGPTQPPETTSGNTRTGRPRRTLDLTVDLAGELAAFTDRLASATDLGAATINNRLAAVDAFFALCGSSRPAVVREHLARPSVSRAPNSSLACYCGPQRSGPTSTPRTAVFPRFSRALGQAALFTRTASPS